MDLSIKEISTIMGLLIMFAGTVTVWVEQKMKVKHNSKDIKKLEREIEKCNTQPDECFGKFEEISSRLNKIDVAIAKTDQKLDDFIRWSKNGRK